ncbi:MAG: extracellular solute-binding protein [Eubacteriales bacterium]|nr:extracellular solute-binding protein [Eubacteriales bacterium]
MKKRLSLLLILGLLLPVLLTTSCQTAEQTSDKTVALKFVRIGNDAAEATYWKRLIGDFNQANPGIKVEYDDAAIGEPMETKLNSMFSAGLGPDIIGHGILSVAARVEAGHYQPITTYFNSWEGKDDLMAAVLANGTYKNEIYGLAYCTTPFIFAWRKDFFSDAGLDPEKAPQNWEELESFSRQLTKKNAAGQIAQSGFAFPRSAGNFVEFDTLVFGNGGLYYNDQGEPTLNTPDKVETLEFLAGFVNDVGIPFNSNETNPFIAGTAAMTLINNVALTPMLKNEAYAGKVGIALPPANKTPATFSGCNMLFVGGDCKQPDEAFQFIAYALTKEEVLTRAKELGIPVTRQSQVDAFIALDPMNAVRAECVAKGVGMPRATWSTTFQKIRNDLVQQVLYGKMNAADALAQAQADLEAEIAAP